MALVTDSGITVTSGVSTHNYTSWTHGTLIFDRTPLRDVVAELSERIADYFELFEEPDASGLNVATLPRHNKDEAWREDGVSRIVASAEWIETA